MITVNLQYAKVTQSELGDLGPRVTSIHKVIHDPNGADNKWVFLPENMASEIDRIKTSADWVRKNCDVLLVLGIGGSYSGTAAGLEIMEELCDFPIKFLGAGFDGVPFKKFMDKYKDARVAVNVISKSGTTLEIVAAFNIIDSFMRKKYPNEADYKNRLFVTTGNSGTMKDFADRTGTTKFDIPEGVGGRFSVLSAVGLFPFAVAGIDIKQIIKGASKVKKLCDKDDNDAYKYALARYLLHAKQGKDVEVFSSFHEELNKFTKWWQQLFGESEGKQGRGIFPCPMIFTRKLHSVGQFIQQGKPILLETVVNIQKLSSDFKFDKGPSMNQLNRAAYLGTVKAHADAGVPVILVDVPNLGAESFGAMVYFFEIACAMSAYLLDVNPFDQPGVEYYKKNMREVLIHTQTK
ncbi:MAG: glucose-6-phosphate isomerase [Firmicutes bacterium]|nr:glucose-6-phosphate isomerase [Bacillota bacterium]